MADESQVSRLPAAAPDDVGASSFKERTLARLSAERGEPAGPPPGYEDGAETQTEPDDQQQATRVGDGYDDAADPNELDGQETDQPTGVEPDRETGESEDDTGDGETLEPEPLSVSALAERLQLDPVEVYDNIMVPVGDYGEQISISELKDKYGDVQRDFAQRAQQLTLSSQAIDEQHEAIEAEAAFYSNLAEQTVKNFDNVNWTALQTEPEKYQGMQREFQQATRNRDQLVTATKELRNRHAEAKTAIKDREAEMSRQVLSFKIPNWGNDLYSELRAFAVDKLDYTAEEFDNFTDWRRIRDIERQFRQSKAPSTVGELKAQAKAKQRPRQRQRAAAQTRNNQGEFANSRTLLQENPGDPTARRRYFQDKLAAERER